MINNEKWINTLNIKTEGNNQKENQLDPNVWIDSLPKPKVKSPIKKYSFTAAAFIVGLIFVSVIKNETRGLQKEIFNLQTSINNTKLDLHNASLDHEVITSPGNISKLAKKHLELELFIYEKSQIKNINENDNNIIENTENKKDKENKIKKLSKKVKTKLENEIKIKKNELKKLQSIAKKPSNIPGEIKLQIVKKIENKKNEIRNLYNNPKTIITPERVQSWAGIQLVKAFLGIPMIPGK